MKWHRKSLNPVRSPMVASRLKVSNAWPVVKLVLLIAGVSVGVLVMILFGFPLIEDLIKDVDPALRYQPKVEKDFSVTRLNEEVIDKQYTPEEVYLADYKTKNDPYIDGERIIFTTRVEKEAVWRLDGVAIYDTETKKAELLPNVERKYDNLLSPVLSGDYAVWIDSLSAGGGRIVGYDLKRKEQFLIKEYGYAIPSLSLSGDLLTFMQWAGDNTQRLYVYNVRTQEAATVKLYEDTVTGNSAADISATDMVWSVYSIGKNNKLHTELKRIVFDGDTSRYDNYELGVDVFEPKTNGKDVVFATASDITSGDLMLSTGGSEPVKIAERVLNYVVGDGFVAYTKDDKIHVCYTNQMKTVVLTPDISKNLLASVNGKAIVYYDITDGVLSDEVVMYVYMD